MQDHLITSRDRNQVKNISSSYNAAKRANLILADTLRLLGYKQAWNVEHCTTSYAFRWCDVCHCVHTTDFFTCQHRLCPICQVRRSRRMAYDALRAFDVMRSSGELDGCELYFLTFTQINVDRGRLAFEIDKMLDAIARLRHTRDARRFIAGSARSIEITYNYEMHTWHPHVHLILILRTPPKSMLVTSYWRNLWARLMDLNYTPHVDFQPIADQGVVFEISKYVAKSSEMLTSLHDGERVDVIDELNRALYERTLIAYTGIWRKTRRALKMVDTDDGSDTPVDDQCECGGAIVDAIMRWNGNEYVPSDLDPRINDLPAGKKLATYALMKMLKNDQDGGVTT